jgi:hypothetical protein
MESMLVLREEKEVEDVAGFGHLTDLAGLTLSGANKLMSILVFTLTFCRVMLTAARFLVHRGFHVLCGFRCALTAIRCIKYERSRQ